MMPRRAARACSAAVLALGLLFAPRGVAAAPDTLGAVGLLWLPDDAASAEPRGVVIALHDMAGIDPRAWRYADQLTAAGITVLHAELRETSQDGFAPLPDDMPTALARLRLVIELLAEDPRFAAAPLGLLAFGTAGEAALLAAAEPAQAERFAGLALLYPGCAALDAAAAGGSAPHAAVLLLHGDADPANTPADCAGLATRLAGTAPVRRVQYAGAGYAWDMLPSGLHEVQRLPWPGRPGQRLNVASWPEGAALSAAQVASFFAATFAMRGP